MLHKIFDASINDMKQALAGAALLLVLGFGYLLYKNVAKPTEAPASPVAQACQQDAKVCPDGTSLGRTGPACEFPACPLPNAEDKDIGLGFVIPAGYVANADAIGADETLRAVFDKPSKGEVPHSIVIRRYAIEAGKTADQTVLSHTMYESSGMTAKSMSEFKKKVIGSHTYYCAQLERFEGQIHTACYLERSTDVLRFEVLEKDVDWTNPALVVENLPEHKAFYAMLGTVTP